MIKKQLNIRLSLANKMILLFMIIAISILGITMSYIVIKERNFMLKNTKEKANLKLEKYAEEITSVIEQDFNIARGILYSIYNYENLDYQTRNNLFIKIVNETVENNPNYASFWIHFDLEHIDTNCIGKRLRKRYTCYRNEINQAIFKTDTLTTDINKISSDNTYLDLKISKKETLLEPYWDSYTNSEEDKFLGTSVCVPIVKNNDFVGLIGADIKLDFFKNWFDKINTMEGTYMFLISNNGTIISHPNDENIGKKINEIFPLLNSKFKLSNYIKVGKENNFKGIDPLSKENGYFWIKPIQLGKENNPWSIGIFVQKHNVLKEVSKALSFSLILFIVSITIILITIGLIIQKQVSVPLKKSITNLKELAIGNIQVKKIKIQTSKEIEAITYAINLLIDNLQKTTIFAKKISEGDLVYNYEIKDEDDILGSSLLNMRTNLINAKNEEEKHKTKEEKRNWKTQGNAKLSEILRKYNNNIEELSFNVLNYLTSYLNAIQGSLYIKKEKGNNDFVFELTGSIAYGRFKNDKQEFLSKEGLVGRCAFERIILNIENVPENYVYVTSGLEQKNPQIILLVPAILNQETYAVIELISFHKFEKDKIEFLEKISEGIASTIANVKTNEQTKKLLEQSKYQNKELSSREEEIRQNVEELQATQEEVQRLRKEEGEKIKEAEIEQKTLQKIIDKISCRVFLKNSEGKIIAVNEETAKNLNMTKQDIIGKTEAELLNDPEAAQIIWEEDKSIIADNKSVTKIHQDYFFQQKQMVETIKIPFFIKNLESKGILYVQTKLSDIENMNDKIKQLKIELSRIKNEK